MRIKLMILAVGILLLRTNLYAADGDLIVNGNVGIGTTTPQAKLDVNGNISVVINGKRLNLLYYNFNEDAYGSYSPIYYLCGFLSDSCNGDINTEYSCLPSDSKVCTDVKNVGGDLCNYRSITCKQIMIFAEP